MKTRNFVAKHAQSSGAGKHKRKDKTVKEPNYDYWNDADQQTIDYNEIQYLEDKVADLEKINEELREDEVFTLAEIMLIRDHYSDYRDIGEELDRLIGMHHKDVRKKAQDRLLKEYPNRNWGDIWQLG